MKSVNNIKLDGERSTHLNKRLNRLSSTKFFGVLYRVNMGRMLLVNLMILLCCIPVYYVLMMAISDISTLSSGLPTYGSFALSSGLWVDVNSYLSSNTTAIYQSYLLWFALGGLTLTIVFSGIFAILRDAFWVGNMKVFSSFARGIKANIGYAFVSALLICGMATGIVWFYWYVYPTVAVWAGIIMLVVMAIVFVFVTIYLFILCSVTVTYKQSVGSSLLDSWNLYMQNIIPNIFKFCMYMLPVLLLLLTSSTIQSLLVVIMLMVGLFYIPFVWQTHMMQVFALFHPIEQVKKKDLKTNGQQKAKA